MANEPTLGMGRNNDADWVGYLQGQLQAHGYDPGPIDGIFGPRTDLAVSQFQNDRGLLVDGVVGRQTWASIEGEPPQPPGTDIGPPAGQESSSPIDPDPEAGTEYAFTYEVTVREELRVADGRVSFAVANTGSGPWGAGQVTFLLTVFPLASASELAMSEWGSLDEVNVDEYRAISRPLALVETGTHVATLTIFVGGSTYHNSSVMFDHV